MTNAEEILDFWFGGLDPPEARFETWFEKSENTDREIRERFAQEVEAAWRGEYGEWKETARGRLALIIMLDQFPRNIHRNTARAFKYDEDARRLSEEGIELGHDRELPLLGRLFFYLPLEHHEDARSQLRSVLLYKELLDEAPENERATWEMVHDYALRHRDIIERFGRFPHRNEALGRKSTEEEIEFLKQPGSSF